MKSGQSWKILVVIIALLCGVTPAKADLIKDRLDTEKAKCAASIEKANTNLLASFDAQIKALSQTGDLSAVEDIQAQRKAFTTTQTLPTATAMRYAVAQFQLTTGNATAELKTAYETALSDYTKAQDYDDANLIKQVIAEKFPTGPSQSAPTAAPADTILEKLQTAKKEFVAAVLDAHNDLLKVIDNQMNAASAKGDLDGYKQLEDWRSRVAAEFFVPDDVKDTTIRNAGAKFTRTAEAAFQKLLAAYRTAVSDYTKAKKIEEAEAIRSEMEDGGWFENYAREQSGQVVPSSLDLLKTIDIAQDTIRKGWQFNNGVLEPTGWDDDHGPFIKIPVGVRGNYILKMSFTLAKDPEAIYVRVPIGDKWALLVIASHEQTFENIQGKGQLFGRDVLDLNGQHDATFVVRYPSQGQVEFALIIDDHQTLAWSGPVEKAYDVGEVWGANDPTCFAIDTKSGRILGMELKAFAPVKKR